MEFIGTKMGYSTLHNLIGCTFDYPQFTIVICYKTSGELDKIDVIMDEDYIDN